MLTRRDEVVRSGSGAGADSGPPVPLRRWNRNPVRQVWKPPLHSLQPGRDSEEQQEDEDEGNGCDEMRRGDRSMDVTF